MCDLDGSPNDLPDNVMESISFLELNVLRLSNGSLTFTIYRKPCHVGNYIHAYSHQPVSQKRSVIRSLFLRAYRYCSSRFMQAELLRIKQDFSKLGYTTQFIEECRVSAYKGRVDELRKDSLEALHELPFAFHTSKPEVNKEPVATLSLPYHPIMLKLKPKLHRMGIRLAFSSNSTLRQQLQGRTHGNPQPRGSVYIINCSSCSDVYVGETGKNVEERMREHELGNQQILGAVQRHNSVVGHRMDTRNPTQVFHSDSVYVRRTVEAALIHSAPTVENNTASASMDNNDVVAPVICRSTRLKWTNVAKCVPNFPLNAVPWHKRNLFGDQAIQRPARHLRSDVSGTPVAHSTRTRRALRPLRRALLSPL